MSGSGQAKQRHHDHLHILVSITGGYAHWFEHLHRNLHMLSLASRMHVCAFDPTALQLARSHGVSVVDEDALRQGWGRTKMETSALPWGGELYKKVVQRKSSCVLRFLSSAPEYAMVLVTDADVTLFADPVALFRSHLRGWKLMAFMVDEGSGSLNCRRNCTSANGMGSSEPNFYNSGFMLMRVCHRTRDFWKRVVAWQEAKGDDALDQEAVNQILFHYPAVAGRYGALDEDAFLNGHRFYERRPLRHPSKVVAVHHNWIHPDALKWSRAFEYGALANDSHIGSELFLEHARQQMAHAPRWQWRRPQRRWGAVLRPSTVLARETERQARGELDARLRNQNS